jgi:acyl-coenzyme A synthetase/AMP-(fatty) acid ligase
MDSIPKNATGKMSRKFVAEFFKDKKGVSKL